MSLGLAAVHAGRQSDLACELAEAALSPVVALIAHRLVRPRLAPNSQYIALHRDFQVVRVHTGNRRGDHDVVAGLINVERQAAHSVSVTGSVVYQTPRSHPGVLEQLVHRLTQAQALTEGVPTYDVRHLRTSCRVGHLEFPTCENHIKP